MDYGGEYMEIRKAVHEAGFDEFYQAGSVSQFHKMNIVCESQVLGARFWVCIDGGYGAKDEFYIARRNLSTNGPDERAYYKTQGEMADAIAAIGKEIREAKAKMALGEKSVRADRCRFHSGGRCSLNGYPPFDCGICREFKPREVTM